MKRMILASLLSAIGSLTAAHAASGLTWAGCGISKNAFMAEMAAAYKKKTGIDIDLRGGGAT